MKKVHDVIIGGTRGIGRAYVHAMAEMGHTVSVLGRRPPPENRDVSQVHYWTVDLSDRKRLSLVLAGLVEQQGQVNHLVFFQRYRGEEDAWAGELDVSLTATRCIVERLADHFDGTADNAIVIVGSVASQFITEEQPVSYHVAKAGLHQMVRYYAVALGPRGIRVNAVSPGTVLKEESQQFYQQDPVSSLYKRIIPLGRMGTAEDVVQLIAFLCSPQAAFVTGQNIVIDGGASLQGHEALARKVAGLDPFPVTRHPSESSK